MSQQGSMAARMVKCYKRNNNKLLLNTCKLEMKTKTALPLVFVHLRTPLQLSITLLDTSKRLRILNGKG